MTRGCGGTLFEAAANYEFSGRLSSFFQLLVDAMGELGDMGVVRSRSRMAPLTVTSTFREPARSRCSHSQTPCQVPRFSLPSDTGTVRLEPMKHAFTCAG